MTESTPTTDNRNPGEVVIAMVEHVLDLASTWPLWDGEPKSVHVAGEAPRIYTPHKAIRRVTDHLIDHLAEVESRLSGCAPEPDSWHGSLITSEADLASFSSQDFDEACSRLRRLAQIWDTRLRSLTDMQLDHAVGKSWTIRQIAFHVAESDFYADSIGRITR